MSYHSRQLFLALCLLLILVLGVAACGDDGQDEPFRIGVMESLTGAGETYGTVANQSKQMAADEINAAGGIYGRMLEFIIEDSKCKRRGRHRRLPQAHRHGFRDCLYGITWSGAIGDDYSFDSDGEVVGLSRVVVEVLPTAERTADRKYRVLGPAPRG